MIHAKYLDSAKFVWAKQNHGFEKGEVKPQVLDGEGGSEWAKGNNVQYEEVAGE